MGGGNAMLDPDHHFTAYISQDAQGAPNCEPCINLFSKVEGKKYGIIIRLHLLRMETDDPNDVTELFQFKSICE